MVKGISVAAGDKIWINKHVIHHVAKHIKDYLEINYEELQFNFVSREFLLTLNKKHLKHHHNTDVITFDYSEDKKNLEGEIYISVDDAKENAIEFKCDFQEELLRLMIHGVLHLCGYKDKDKKDQELMKQIEDKMVIKIKPVLAGKEIVG